MHQHQHDAAGGDQERIERSHRNEQRDERPEAAVNIEMAERDREILEKERRTDHEDEQRKILRLESKHLAEDSNEQNKRDNPNRDRSEEHTSELQSLRHLVCRLLLEKKKK